MGNGDGVGFVFNTIIINTKKQNLTDNKNDEKSQ